MTPTPRPVRPGGLFRCCVESARSLPAHVRDEEGAKVKCKFCGEGLRFRDGAWEWDHPKEKGML